MRGRQTEIMLNRFRHSTCPVSVGAMTERHGEHRHGRRTRWPPLKTSGDCSSSLACRALRTVDEMGPWIVEPMKRRE